MKTITTADPRILADAFATLLQSAPPERPIFFQIIVPNNEVKIPHVPNGLSFDEYRQKKITSAEERILHLCSGDDGETLGVIYNRMRGKKRTEIDQIVSRLHDEGRLVARNVRHAKTGKLYMRIKTA